MKLTLIYNRTQQPFQSGYDFISCGRVLHRVDVVFDETTVGYRGNRTFTPKIGLRKSLNLLAQETGLIITFCRYTSEVQVDDH